MATTISTTSFSSKSKSQSHSESKSQSQSQSQSTTKKVLDEKLLQTILSGLTGRMTDEEISAYAENLLRPTLSAQLEAAQQNYETAKLSREQEIESLAAALSRDIGKQERAYARSAAQVQTAALARGMGRSSYALETLAQQGNELARAVRELTQESTQKEAHLRDQITQAAQQNAQTQGRLNADYAKQLAASVQEMKRQQNQQYNSNYLAAVTGSMGSQTTGTQQSTGTSTTDTQSTSKSSGSSTTVTKRIGGSTKKTSNADQVDAISGAAPKAKK